MIDQVYWCEQDDRGTSPRSSRAVSRSRHAGGPDSASVPFDVTVATMGGKFAICDRRGRGRADACGTVL